MFDQVLTRLTADQKHDLAARGIPRQLLSNWKTGRRKPTPQQVVHLAEVAGVNRHALQDEITLLSATPKQRAMLQGALGKLKAGALASLALGLAGVAANVAMTTEAARTTMYIMLTL